MVLILSLVGGLAIALTFQLLFANLGIALGLSLLDFSPADRKTKEVATEVTEATEATEVTEASTEGTTLSLPITNIIGAGVLLSATTTIFVAALVSTEFSDLIALRRGIIFSLIVWALYWLLFIWLSTTTLTSVVDSILGTAIAGGRELLSLTKRARRSAPEQTPEQDSEAAMLQAMSQELSSEIAKISAAQKALPALLAEQRADLIKEVCDRTQLSPTQADTVLSSVAPPTPSPSSKSSNQTPAYSASSANGASTGLLASLGSAAKTKVLSAVESQIDIPSWQEVSQKIIQNVDISDLESLWKSSSFSSNFLAASPKQDQAVEQAEAENLSDDISPNALDLGVSSLETSNLEASNLEASDVLKTKEKKQPSAATKALQKKLIAYCRYTNSTALTPENLLEKIETQQEAKKIEDLSQTQLDIDAIATIISSRKSLSAEKKRALIKTLDKAIAPPAKPNKSASHPSAHDSLDALVETKQKIAQYLYHRDKTSLQPKQVVQDLTRIVGSGLQAIPHPSQLPATSQIETLWDLSAWRQVLEKRKDMTIEETQQILHWLESGWEPVAHQANEWIQTMQTEASQLLDAPEEIIDEARQQIVEQVGQVKETVEAQAIALKKELQTQAEATRRQAAIAAWWLFGAISISCLAAGSAGWLAIQY